MTTSLSLSRPSVRPRWRAALPLPGAVAVVLALVLGCVLPASATARDLAPDESVASATTASATAIAEEVLSILNAARREAGCGPLRLNARLMAAARTHATNMATMDFFGHANKDGSRFSTRVRKQGYKFRMVAENIAAGQSSARQVAHDWLGSPGHRKNILNCKLRDTGVAVAYQADDQPIMGNSQPFRFYWVQVFGTR